MNRLRQPIGITKKVSRLPHYTVNNCECWLKKNINFYGKFEKIHENMSVAVGSPLRNRLLNLQLLVYRETGFGYILQQLEMQLQKQTAGTHLLKLVALM